MNPFDLEFVVSHRLRVIISTMKKTIAASLILAGVLSTGIVARAEPDLSKLPPASDKKGLTFDKDIKPIFEKS